MLIGHAIGKYGIDILAPATGIKSVSTYRKLKDANRICELESMALSSANKEAIVSSSLKEEVLAYRAENNLWMPMRLKKDIKEKNILCLKNGLEIYFEHLLPGERMQIQFVIAWSSTKNRSLSTWTAVEQSCNDLLRYAGFL